MKTKLESVPVEAVEQFTDQILAQLRMMSVRFPAAQSLVDKLSENVRNARDEMTSAIDLTQE